MTLDDFLVANRQLVIDHTRAMVAARGSEALSMAEQNANGIPAFVDQLVVALRLAKSTDVVDHVRLVASGAQHGADVRRMGLPIAEVVRDYGDVCQTITELAVEHKADISASEFQTLNLCLDHATAEAVTTFASHNQRSGVRDAAESERLGVLAHELRNLLNTAVLAFESIRSGRVAAGGSTGNMLGQSLLGIRDLVDRSLADVRLDAGSRHLEDITVAGFVEELEIGAALAAKARGVRLTVGPVGDAVTIHGDRQILAAALANLLQNAFKFTRNGGAVSLTTVVAGDRVLFNIEDGCGGLPPGASQDLFRPFRQSGNDRSGLGLGLTICRRAAEAHGGAIHVRDLPGKGCIFTLDLPVREPRHDS